MCSKLTYITPKIYIQVLTSGNLRWNKVFAEVVKLRGGHSGLGKTINSMTGVLIRREEDSETQTQKKHREDKAM